MPNRRTPRRGDKLNEAESLDCQCLWCQRGAHVLCHSEDEAVAARARFPGDVVVKGCSRDVTHNPIGIGFSGCDD